MPMGGMGEGGYQGPLGVALCLKVVIQVPSPNSWGSYCQHIPPTANAAHLSQILKKGEGKERGSQAIRLPPSPSTLWPPALSPRCSPLHAPTLGLYSHADAFSRHPGLPPGSARFKDQIHFRAGEGWWLTAKGRNGPAGMGSAGLF